MTERGVEVRSFETAGPLGTHIVVKVTKTDDRVAREINDVVLTTIERFESELSTHRPTSGFMRWRKGDGSAPPAAVEVLREMEHWRLASEGALDPLTSQPAVSGTTAAHVRPYRFDGDRLVSTGDCSAVDIQATAKGWIIDRAAEAAAHGAPDAGVSVAGGGDVRFVGPGIRRIGIENPLRPYDNEPPLAVIDLPAGAIATSGPARRRDAAGSSHLLDPRTGSAPSGISSVSVVADLAAAADSAATAAAVMAPQDGLSWLVRQGLAALIVGDSGDLEATELWTARFGEVS